MGRSTAPEAAVEAIRRGVMLANTAPSGPVYVNLDVTIQEQKIETRQNLGDVAYFSTPENAEPPKTALAEALKILSKARKPFIFCGRGSRRQSEWDDRIKLTIRMG